MTTDPHPNDVAPRPSGRHRRRRTAAVLGSLTGAAVLAVFALGAVQVGSNGLLTFLDRPAGVGASARDDTTTTAAGRTPSDDPTASVPDPAPAPAIPAPPPEEPPASPGPPSVAPSDPTPARRGPGGGGGGARGGGGGGGSQGDRREMGRDERPAPGTHPGRGRTTG